MQDFLCEVDLHSTHESKLVDDEWDRCADSVRKRLIISCPNETGMSLPPTFKSTIVAMIRPMLSGSFCSATMQPPPASRTDSGRVSNSPHILSLMGELFLLRDNGTIGHHAMRGRYRQFRTMSPIAKGATGA